MAALDADIRAFTDRKRQEHRQAGQTAAFFLACGVDLAEALASTGEQRMRFAARLERLIERERLRGVRRHWSYDLNRHIALKQSLDRLRAPEKSAQASTNEKAASMKPPFRNR